MSEISKAIINLMADNRERTFEDICNRLSVRERERGKYSGNLRSLVRKKLISADAGRGDVSIYRQVQEGRE